MPSVSRPIVIIGAGGIVNDAHLPAYRLAGFPVAGIYDLDPQRAAAAARRWEIPQVFSTLAEAISSVRSIPGAVFDVAVPAFALLDVLPHLPMGAPMLIQKPMGENLAQARAIRDLCRTRGFIAGINFQLRFAPYVIAARGLIQEGRIGTLHDMEVRITANTPWRLWTFLEKVPFAEIIYHSIHYIDLMRSFLGEPRGVYAKSVRHPRASNIDGTSSDIALDYDDFLRAVITTNHHHEYGPRHQESYIKWEGDQGAIKAVMGTMLNYPAGQPDHFEFCLLEENQPPSWQSAELPGSWFPEAFIGTMAGLMRFLEGAAPTIPTSVEDAYSTMLLVDAACRSSRSGAIAVAPE
jgi:predicted dehydrogenase